MGTSTASQKHRGKEPPRPQIISRPFVPLKFLRVPLESTKKPYYGNHSSHNEPTVPRSIGTKVPIDLA
ncbi:MAG: hypothetical protein DMG12_21965 [Acidobacteria bacterium]|nr:MAG: hypothetical protein DMG12_21965 [Acidobacteriota bacterium]